MSRENRGILSIAVASCFWVSYTSGQISIFSPTTFKEIFTLTTPLNERSYCLLPHKGLVILISEFGKIALWKEDTRKLLGFYRIPHHAIVKSAVIIGDNLHTADANGVVLVCYNFFLSFFLLLLFYFFVPLFLFLFLFPFLPFPHPLPPHTKEWNIPTMNFVSKKILNGPVLCMSTFKDTLWCGGSGCVFVIPPNEEPVSLPITARFFFFFLLLERSFFWGLNTKKQGQSEWNNLCEIKKPSMDLLR